MRKVTYNGDIKIIKQIVAVLNRKAPLPLDQDENVDWGTDGQVYATDGTGGGKWVTPPAAQVQSDWNEADNTKPDFIKNKPSDATQSASGFMSATDKTKLDGIQSGADAVSWTQDVTTGTKIAEIDINGNTTDVYAPSAGSGGHTIWGRLKATLAQRSRLWFADAKASDASADDATKVEVVTELLNETAFDNLATDGTADGIYTFPDSGGEYLTADMCGFWVLTGHTKNSTGSATWNIDSRVEHSILINVQVKASDGTWYILAQSSGVASIGQIEATGYPQLYNQYSGFYDKDCRAVYMLMSS